MEDIEIRNRMSESNLIKSKSKTKHKNLDKCSYLFLLPAFIIYTTVMVIPTIESLYISLHSWNGVSEKVFIGLRNYTDLLFNDDVFWMALKNNGIWIALTLVFIVSISLMLAMLLNKPFRGRTFFRGLFYFPTILSGILVAIVWRWIYNPNFGFINEFLRSIGLESLTGSWLADSRIALYCVFIAATWQGIGQPMILFLAGLQTIPEDLLEAADIDGASKVRQFFSIKVPLMKETFIIVLATLIVGSMRVYDIVYALTSGGPENSTQTLATYMVQQTFTFSNVGMGTAVAVLMLLMMMVVIIPYVLFSTREA